MTDDSYCKASQDGLIVDTWQISIDGRQLAGYRSEPSPAASVQLCWLHGNGFNSRAYTPVLQQLAQRYAIHTTDLPGHGMSQRAELRWPDWRGMADTVERLMVQHFVSQPERSRIGIGHSLGGVVTLLQAHQYPERFERLILLDPVLFPLGIKLAQATMQRLGLWPLMPLPRAARRRRSRWSSVTEMEQHLAQKNFYRRWHPQALSGFVRDGHQSQEHGVELSCPPEWEARIFASYPRRLFQALRQVSVPVDLICAHHSFPFIIRSARRAAQLNPNIRVNLWGKGHCFPMEQPEQTAQLIEQLLG